MREAPHAGQKRLLQEPVNDFSDSRLFLSLLKGYILETSQVLVKVDLIDTNTSV